MAVSVNTVYQKVLALANKEQRGYITPQEFNLFADQAQMDIFEQYFYDLEQFQRRTDSTEELIQDKIAIFKEGPLPIGDVYDLSDFKDVITGKDNFHKIIQITKSNNNRVAEKIEYEDYDSLQISPLTRATDTRPVFFIKHNAVYVYPETGASSNTISYIRKPKPPNWTYYISSNNNAIYNESASDHRDFELHVSEENSLIIKILQLAGITIKDFGLVQAAAQKEAVTIQQEKQ